MRPYPSGLTVRTPLAVLCLALCSTYNLGASVDDARGEDIRRGARSRNLSIFAGAVPALTEPLDIGGEASQRVTEHKHTDEAAALRGQFSFIYRF